MRVWTQIRVSRSFVNKEGMSNILGVFWFSPIRVLVELEKRPGVFADVAIGPWERDIELNLLIKMIIRGATDTELEPLYLLTAASLSLYLRVSRQTVKIISTYTTTLSI